MMREPCKCRLVDGTLISVFLDLIHIEPVRKLSTDGTLRIPASVHRFCSVGLAGQKIRIQHMTQLMRKQSADHFVSLLSVLFGFHQWSCRIDPDERIVRMRALRVLRFPNDADIHPAVIGVPLALRRSYVSKVSRKNAGHEKLPVGYAVALLIEQLPDFLMIYSCHECSKASFLYRLAAFGCKLPLQYRGYQRIAVVLVGGSLGYDGV